MDFFTVPTVTGRVLFVLVLLADERRRIVHIAITEHPTASWTAQQVIEPFPYDTPVIRKNPLTADCGCES
jgi:putative transposase